MIAPVESVRLLLVEDEERDALHLRELLRENPETAGFRLQWAPGYEEGLTRLSQSPYDLCLVDYTLGRGTGFQFMNQARQGGNRTPMILLSGVEFPRLADEAFKAGALDFLVKPSLDAPALTRTLRYALGQERMKRELEQSRERYELVLRATNEGLWEWDLLDNRMVFSPRWLELLALRPEVVSPTPDEWFGRVHSDDLPALKEALTRHLLGQSETFQCEHRMIDGDNRVVWMQSRAVAVRDAQGKATRMVGGLTNIHARKLAEERLLHDSSTDGLTGLLNRRRFMERLAQEFQLARRHGRRLAVCIGDLDHFKQVNDRQGHMAGDQALSLLGSLLRKHIRVENVAGRYGGDEFCLLFPHARAEEAAVALDRLRSRLERSTLGEEDGHPFHITASFGIAEFHPDFQEPRNLLDAADRALYWAKQWGRNRVVLRDTEGNFSHYAKDRPDRTMSIIPVVSGEPPLRLLLACSEADRPLWLDALKDSGEAVEPIFVTETSEVLDYLLRKGAFAKRSADTAPDLIWLGMKPEEKTALSTLRELKNHPRFRRIPVVLVGHGLLRKDVLQGYELGASAVLRKPDSFEKQTDMLKKLIRFFHETVSLPPSAPLGS